MSEKYHPPSRQRTGQKDVGCTITSAGRILRSDVKEVEEGSVG